MTTTNFENSFHKYQGDMYRVVRREGVPAENARDCVQEAARKLSQMDTISYLEPNKVRGLFCKVAQNIGRDFMRTTMVEIKANQEMGYEKKIINQQANRRRDYEENVSACVHRALSEMSEMDSYLGWRYFAMRMSLREISEDLVSDKGIKWDHVKIHRYIKKIVKPQLKKKLIEFGAQDLL